MIMDSNVISNNPSQDERILFDFGTLPNMNDWLIVNDGVMGGLSRSSFSLSNNHTAVFTGFVTLENNGGFASTRTKPIHFQLDEYKGILIRVKGDGKKYQFRVQTNNRFDGVSYRYLFETTKDQWQTVAIPFDQCVPVFRGRILRNVEPLSPNDIRQMGFLVSDQQTGNFHLEIEWIKAFR